MIFLALGEVNIVVNRAGTNLTANLARLGPESTMTGMGIYR
jgi:hypothetical protein